MKAHPLVRICTTLVLAVSLAASGALAKEAKEAKEPARPKRGSVDLGKGKSAGVDAAKIDMLNGAFGKVVEAVAPCVVAVNTERRWSERDNQMQHPFFEFFGIPNQPPEPDNSPKRNIPLGGGSGFIVNKQGYIFTNAHVVDGADIVKVSLSNKKTYLAKVVGVDKKADVAVLKISAPDEDLPVVAFGDSKKVAIGEWVMAIGNPFGLQNTVTSGIVSAKGRRDQMQGGDSYQDFIQTDAAVNPGNSGGPLVNLKGEVIGINSSIYTRTGGYMGVSFAIPVNMAVKVAEDLIYEGKVTRGYLGIGIDNVSENLAEAMGLSGTQGCLVREVIKNSPAAKGGLKEGDIILKVEDAVVQDASDLRNRVAELRPGEKYGFEVMRDGKRSSMDIRIGSKPDDGDEAGDDAQSAPEPEESNGSFYSKKLGFRFGALDKDARARFSIPGEKSGVVVTGVSDGSSAAENGMVEGMLILSFKSQSERAFQKAEDPRKLLGALKALKAGEKIAFKIFFKGRTDFVALQAEE